MVHHRYATDSDSARTKGGGLKPTLRGLEQPNALLTPHSCYQDLGSTNQQRAEAYRAIVSETLPQSTIDEIRLYLQQQRAFGRDAFRAMVEAKTQYFAGVRPAHRPCKHLADIGK